MKEQKTDHTAHVSSAVSRRQLLSYAAPLGVSAALAAVATHPADIAAAATRPTDAPMSTLTGPSSSASAPTLSTPHITGRPADVLASAMWIQGNALTVESPAAVVQTLHIGWGTVVYGVLGKSSWFHIPVPSPVVINDARPRLTKVFLMFDVGAGMGYISNVHLYDGPYNFKQFNGLYLVGDHRTYLDGANTLVLDAPQTIYLALGISFHFQFAACFDGGCATPWFTISSAGGDFHL